ncbi:MAG: rhodanese-like domain-containing protein [Maribacter sp.]
MLRNISTYLILTLIANHALSAQEKTKLTAKVDYSRFLQISEELSQYRDSRMIDIETFNSFSKDSNTIILDTRSKKAYDEIHLKGAIHLNFSDFTKKALAEKIANKNTRILIYCNNNFESPRASLMNKMTPLALNIPTFINLYGYGYENIYELQDYLTEDDNRVQFEITTD